MSTDGVTCAQIEALDLGRANVNVVGGRKLVEAEENGFGEYFLISSSGDLEFWSKESGNYYTAKAIAK